MHLKRVLSLTLLCRHPWAVTNSLHIRFFSGFPRLHFYERYSVKDNLKTTVFHIAGPTAWHDQVYKAILSLGREGNHHSFFPFFPVTVFLSVKKHGSLQKLKLSFELWFLSMWIFFIFLNTHDITAFDNTEVGMLFLMAVAKGRSHNPKHNLKFRHWLSIWTGKKNTF